MNNIKSEFTIKDLENFSGIKAHTIRIWEKRYNLLQPQRTDSNIRFYNLESLQKLLNVNLLYNNGLKISKIAKLSDAEMIVSVADLTFTKGFKTEASNSLKLAMLNFDEQMFNQIYNSLLASNTFQYIFTKVFMPFLNEIGVLWQVNSITPAHEHFITNLVKQKIHINIEKIQHLTTPNRLKKFVLYLPMNEIHELGLLYLHFELLLRGYYSIYLGQSVPTENLQDLKDGECETIYITYLTVEPSKDSVEFYADQVYNSTLINSNDSLWVLGSKTSQIEIKSFDIPQVKIFKSPLDLLKIV
ncbi:MAG: MerR family transcriptional regulator [Lutibacter sp.]|uniref:MerR family transcriptional regulator n=1 Tax=Lutibacter sp. TaxID=1925666 RepID=UPI00182DA013|nr:B12-binding domain-containing protein [Lutibacter sp.]MBT8318120.1 MerR family transcriptional regulator [Lutibacter sp.]NNJ58980.1 MerR family transcriptional regulator [Lutibacter sp.]